MLLQTISISKAKPFSPSALAQHQEPAAPKHMPTTFFDTQPTPPLTQAERDLQPPRAKMAHLVRRELGVMKGDKSQLSVMSQRSWFTTPQNCDGCGDDTNYSSSSAPFKERGWMNQLETQDVVCLWRLGDKGQLILIQRYADGFAFSNTLKLLFKTCVCSFPGIKIYSYSMCETPCTAQQQRQHA